MMKRFYILLLTLFSTALSAQDLDSLVLLYNEKLPQEKLHLHLDKEMYVAGETIWLKGYMQIGNTPSPLSTSLFLELIDGSGRILQRRILPLIESSAHGDIALPDTLSSGYYSIRAYTTWMLNFEEEFLYKRRIFIYNSKTTRPSATQSDVYTVNFFPEGGYIVADVVNYVAVKATNALGYPVEATGELLDSKGNSITDIKTTHDGMGRFTLLAAPGETYSANLKFQNGKTATVQLPAVKADGLTIHVDEAGNNKRIVLTRAEEGKPLNLVMIGSINHDVVIKKEVLLDKESVMISLPMQGLPSGILLVTILDNNHRPLVERVTFINNNDYKVNGTLKADTVNMNRRMKNVFTFSVPDTIEGNYSVAVTDINKAPITNDRDDIVSRLLLTSALKGYVHNPAYYLSANDKKTKDNLDLVMMTNGWRKINWEQVKSMHYPEPAYKPLHYLSLSGKVYAENSKQLMTSGDLNFLYKPKSDSVTQFAQSPVDSNGRFVISGLVFTDTAYTLYNLNTTKKNRQPVRVVLDRTSIWPNNPYFTRPSLPIDVPDTLKLVMKKIQDDLQNYSAFIAKATMLKEVKISGRKRSPTQLVEQRYVSSAFSTIGGRTFDLINKPIAGNMTLVNYILNNIPRVTYSNGQFVRNLTTSITGGPQPVTLFFDEMVSDVATIDNLPISEIALVRYEDKFVLAPNLGPAIMVYRKRPEDMQGDYSSVLPRFYFPGYSITRTFYSPDYDVPNENHAAPDVRTTLFWDPNVLLDKDNRQHKIRFFSSDNVRSVRVIIEGFASDGRLLRLERSFSN